MADTWTTVRQERAPEETPRAQSFGPTELWMNTSATWGGTAVNCATAPSPIRCYWCISVQVIKPSFYSSFSPTLSLSLLHTLGWHTPTNSDTHVDTNVPAKIHERMNWPEHVTGYRDFLVKNHSSCHLPKCLHPLGYLLWLGHLSAPLPCWPLETYLSGRLTTWSSSRLGTGAAVRQCTEGRADGSNGFYKYATGPSLFMSTA